MNRTRADWRAQLDHDVKFAKKRLLAQGTLTPMFGLHACAGLFLVPTPWNDEAQKFQYLTIVRLFAVMHNAYGAVFMCEAWVKGRAKRVDALAVIEMWRDDAVGKQTLTAVFEILRDEDWPKGFKTISDDITTFDGSLADVLPDQETNIFEQAQAAEILKSLPVQLDLVPLAGSRLH